MKTIKTLFLMAALSAGLSILIAQQPPGPAGAPAAAAPAAAAAPDEEVPETVAPQPKDESAVDPVMQRLLDKAKQDRSGALEGGLERVPLAPKADKPDMEPAGAGTASTVEPVDASPVVGSTTPVPGGSFAGTEGLRMNFVNAPLDTVLNWMSSAAGFIVVKEVRSTARVNVVSLQPMTKDEVVDLLNSVLYKVGIAIIRNNRTLTIVSLDEAKTRGIPVSLWDGDPDSIPKSDVTVTMVLPVRFVTVAELLQNVLPLVAPTTPLTANQSGNSIIITDTQANIRRVAEVIKAVDSGAEDVTVVKVFTLKYANPQEIADEISNLFANNGQQGRAAAPMVTGGGRGGRGGAMGGMGGMGAAGGQRMRASNPVVAVPDMRTGSVVVTASRDIIDNISDTVNALDEGAGVGRNDTLQVFHVDNAEPSEVYQTLTDIFNKNGTSSRNNNTQLNNSALTQRQQQNTLGTSRTSSLGSSSGFGGGGTGGGGMGGGATGMGGGGGGR